MGNCTAHSWFFEALCSGVVPAHSSASGTRKRVSKTALIGNGAQTGATDEKPCKWECDGDSYVATKFRTQELAADEDIQAADGLDSWQPKRASQDISEFSDLGFIENTSSKRSVEEHREAYSLRNSLMVNDSSNVPLELSYLEMRLVAQKIHNLQKRGHILFFGCLAFGALIVFATLLLLGVAIILAASRETEVKDAGYGGLVLTPKKHRLSDTVVTTAPSLRNIDAADLVEYRNSFKDRNGDADGDWVMRDSELSLIRTVSWKVGQLMEVHRVAGITRHDGVDTRAEINTMSGHLITIWDHDGSDNYNVMMKRYIRDNATFAPEVEINAEGDENAGRGRVLIGMLRPDLWSSRPVSIDDYLND